MGLLAGFNKWIKLRNTELELQSLAIGINSTADFTKNAHIVMLDYDIPDLNLVEESVKELQEFWKLGNAHIIKTRNGHHAYFFTSIVPYGRLRQIIEFARYVDPMYIYISRYYSHKTLRVAGKYKDKDLEFVKLISSKYHKEDPVGNMKKSEFESLSGVQLS